MKFLFSDSLDYVDPEYDFMKEQSRIQRRSHQDDDYPHEHLDCSPYDGILVSRAIVGDSIKPGKYSDAQSMRFRREGARSFLRYDVTEYPGSMVMGDCGAFSYRTAKEPPYAIDDTVEFYEDGGFTHGCSVDHLIFDFLDDRAPAPKEAKRRQEITLGNAEEFLSGSKILGRKFTPVGVIQGWSARSMAQAANDLSRMGYKYLAVGGMVPLRIDQIEKALFAIREAIPKNTRLHLLGFGKTEELETLQTYKVSSFDTTSPLLRAFKDGKRNYYSVKKNGDIDYYTAVRIPQAIDNDKLLRRAKKGRLNQESLLRLEADALHAVRQFSKKKASLEDAVSNVIAYGRYALWDDVTSEAKNEARLKLLRETYMRTLGDRPWENCRCRVCRESGVEALIFRSSNRNKRRGFHNLHVFYSHLQKLSEK